MPRQLKHETTVAGNPSEPVAWRRARLDRPYRSRLRSKLVVVMSRSNFASFAVSAVKKVPPIVWIGCIVGVLVVVTALALRFKTVPLVS